MTEVLAEARKPVYSVTSLIAYEACPLQYHTTFVRGIPPPVTPSMRRGTNIHSLIAGHFRQRSLVPLETEPSLQGMFDRFQASRFNVDPVAVESPFLHPFGPGDVRGRIDLVLPREGGLEVVDFKSGSPRSRDELAARLQLPLYALAVGERFHVPPQDVAYTYYFLGEGTEESFSLDPGSVQSLTERVEGIMALIQAGQFQRRSGCRCYACRWILRRRTTAPPR